MPGFPPPGATAHQLTRLYRRLAEPTVTTGQLTRQRTEEAALPRRPDSGLASRFPAIAAGQRGHYEELAAARAGTATAVLVIDAIPNWAGRAAAAEDRQ